MKEKGILLGLSAKKRGAAKFTAIVPILRMTAVIMVSLVSPRKRLPKSIGG
jgi:hypothetical protein